MHRTKLLNLLEKHESINTKESAMQEALTAFVRQNPECYKRELLIGHVTGSAWIVDKTRQFTLLVHHRKLDKWLQPGGHCDGEADVLKVALKEAVEETGVEQIRVVSEDIFDVDIHQIPECKGIPAHLHYDVRFLLEADMDIPLIISDESNDLAWIPIQKVAELNNEESILRMIRKTPM